MQPSRSSPSPPTAAAAPRGHGLLAAWLLLLLDGGENHGWALFAAICDRGIVADRSHAYRTLRDLERDGAVTSRWTASGRGPRRRSYELTAQGRDALAELAAQISAEWQQDEAFLRAHRRPPPRREPALAEHVVEAGRLLLAGWVLLLLEKGASYGYELRRALEEQQLHPDPAAMYRLLRELDRAGWVQSRWMRPVAGPRRRMYRIRAAGRRNLDEVACAIAILRDRRAEFLRAYARTRDASDVPGSLPAPDPDAPAS